MSRTDARRFEYEVSEYARVAISYNTPQIASGRALATVPAGSKISDISIHIETAFNAGTTNDLVGATFVGGSNLFTALDAVAGVAGYKIPTDGANVGRGLVFAADTTLIFSYNYTGTPPTQGRAVIVIKYTPTATAIPATQVVGGSATLLTLPTNFLSRWTPAAFNLYETPAGLYSTDINYASLKPAITKSYYVKAGGSDVAAGGIGTELASLSVALAKSDVDEVVIDCSGGDYIMRGSLGWNNTQPTRSLSVRVIGPGRAISVAASTTSAPNWVLHAGSIFKTTITAANSASVVDLANLQQDGYYQRLTVAASLATMTPGTYFHNGTDLYVWAFDGRSLVGDQRMCVCSESNNIRIPSANRTVYIDGLDAVGGAPLLYVAAGAVDPVGVFLNCTFQSSRSTGSGSLNNVSLEGPGRFYTYRCGSGRAWRDGFGYTGNANGSPRFFENENRTDDFGGFVGPSDNSSTSHNDSAGVRLNCFYGRSLNRTIIDVNDVRSIILGCNLRQPRTGAIGNELLVTANTVQMWIAAVTFEAGPNPQLSITAGTSTVSYRKMAAPIRAGTGEDTGTLAVWA